MNERKLLLVTTSYPLQADGRESAGAFVAALAAELSRHMPVCVLAPGPLPGWESQGDRLAIWRFWAPSKPLSQLNPLDSRDWLSIVRTLCSMRRQALVLGRAEVLQHCMALWVLPSGWTARLLHAKTGVPYSLWALGSDIWSLGKHRLGRRMIRRVARDASGCYADGFQLAADAGDIAGREFEFLPSTRQLEYPAVEEATRSKGSRLLFLGRWHPNKGADLLMQALLMLDEVTWRRIGEFHIAGGGPLEPEVTRVAAALSSAGRPVRMSGYLDPAQAASALSHADWIVIPSRIESIPVVFSDAMKAGRPVISTPVGDLPALLEAYRCGILASDASAAAIASAITLAVSTPEERFADGVRSAAAAFDLTTIASRIADRVRNDGQQR